MGDGGGRNGNGGWKTTALGALVLAIGGVMWGRIESHIYSDGHSVIVERQRADTLHHAEKMANLDKKIEDAKDTIVDRLDDIAEMIQTGGKQ